MPEGNENQKWWQDRAEKVFEQAFFEELYLHHVLPNMTISDYHGSYSLEPDQRGTVVALTHHPSQKNYRVVRITKAERPTQPIGIQVCTFWETVYIPTVWLSQGISSLANLDEKVAQGGCHLAEQIGEKFIEMLLAAVEPDSSVQATDLDAALADRGDSLSSAGFDADTVLLPKTCLHRLIQQGIVVKDDRIKSRHYVGQTKTGLSAFWSAELPEDTLLVLASSGGAVVTMEPMLRTRRFPSQERASYGLTGEVYLNPLVRDSRAITAIKGTEDVVSLHQPAGSASSSVAAEVPPVIGEIQAVLGTLPFLKATKAHVMADFEQVARAYQSEAYKACVIMCGAVMEGLLLGNLERAKNIKLLWDCGRLTRLQGYPAARRELHTASLEDLINHTRKTGGIEGFTDELARVVQRCRNSVHPGKVLRGDEVFDAFDRKVADLALNVLNVLCSLVAAG